MLYSSYELSTDIIRSGKYVGLLYMLQTSLNEWKQTFDVQKGTPGN